MAQGPNLALTEKVGDLWTRSLCTKWLDSENISDVKPIGLPAGLDVEVGGEDKEELHRARWAQEHCREKSEVQ